MEDDIIAYLYPYNDSNNLVTDAIQANSRCVPPRCDDTTDQYSSRGRHERESTEPPENPGASPLDYLPSLVVRLSDIPQTDKGLIFGSNPNCDVVLNYSSISEIHFSLTFDDHNRPIIKDLGSLMGTQVTYKRQGEGRRRNFQWIVGDVNLPFKCGETIIRLPSHISLKIVCPRHDTTSPSYIEKVKKFKKGTGTTESLLKDLGLYPPSRAGRETQPLETGPIYLQWNIDQGSFGTVDRLWNVSNAQDRAVKKPSLNAIKALRVDHSAWKREADLMRSVDHPHIVRLLKSVFKPQPELHLEYMAGGSLNKYTDISYNETLAIARQCSSALAYLHGQPKPIAHRDIKPGNILVEHRSADGISVKLGDFGLSRYGEELSTFCGTTLYLAPEVYANPKRNGRGEKKLAYTAAVDMWSLGVVAYKLIYGLPPHEGMHQGNGLAWCATIMEGIKSSVLTRPTALGALLRDFILVKSPQSRHSAGEFCDLLDSLTSSDESSFRASTHGSTFDQESQMSFRYVPQGPVLDARFPEAVPHQRATGSGADASLYSVDSGELHLPSFSSSGMAQRVNELSEAPSFSLRQHANRQRDNAMSRLMNDFSPDTPHTNAASSSAGWPAQPPPGSTQPTLMVAPVFGSGGVRALPVPAPHETGLRRSARLR